MNAYYSETINQMLITADIATAINIASEQLARAEKYSDLYVSLQNDIKTAIESFADFLEEQESDILESDAFKELAEKFDVVLDRNFKGTITVVFKFTGSAPRNIDLDEIRNRIGFTDNNQDCVTVDGNDVEIFESYFNHMADQEIEIDFV